MPVLYGSLDHLAMLPEEDCTMMMDLAALDISTMLEDLKKRL